MYIIEWSNALLHKQINCHNSFFSSPRQSGVPHKRTGALRVQIEVRFEFRFSGPDCPTFGHVLSSAQATNVASFLRV
jgi:hypothetical protein